MGKIFAPHWDVTVGDRVMFARHFLRANGIFTGELPFQIGTVSQLTAFRHSGGATVVVVTWDGGGTSNVLTSNLVRRDRRHLEAV